LGSAHFRGQDAPGKRDDPRQHLFSRKHDFLKQPSFHWTTHFPEIPDCLDFLEVQGGLNNQTG
jgi:hypothetical protein